MKRTSRCCISAIPAVVGPEDDESMEPVLEINKVGAAGDAPPSPSERRNDMNLFYR
jgi:hypothetical protein